MVKPVVVPDARVAGGSDLSSYEISPADPLRSAGEPCSFTSVSLPHAPNPEGLARMGAAAIRSCFPLESLFERDRVALCPSEIDRATADGAVPGSGPLEHEAPSEFRSDFFAQRRELGIFNIGRLGVVRVDGTSYRLTTRDAVYIGRGSRDVCFESEDGDAPAVYYFVIRQAGYTQSI